MAVLYAQILSDGLKDRDLRRVGITSSKPHMNRLEYHLTEEARGLHLVICTA